jgi:hypothetical protein
MIPLPKKIRLSKNDYKDQKIQTLEEQLNLLESRHLDCSTALENDIKTKDKIIAKRDDEIDVLKDLLKKIYDDDASEYDNSEDDNSEDDNSEGDDSEDDDSEELDDDEM